MAGLDDRPDEARHADAVGPHMNGRLPTFGGSHAGIQGLGVFRAEVEDVANLDAPALITPLLRNLLMESRLLVLLIGTGIELREVFDDLVHLLLVLVVDVPAQNIASQEPSVAEDYALAGIGQGHEL